MDNKNLVKIVAILALLGIAIAMTIADRSLSFLYGYLAFRFTNWPLLSKEIFPK